MKIIRFLINTCPKNRVVSNAKRLRERRFRDNFHGGSDFSSILRLASRHRSGQALNPLSPV